MTHHHDTPEAVNESSDSSRRWIPCISGREEVLVVSSGALVRLVGHRLMDFDAKNAKVLAMAILAMALDIDNSQSPSAP